MGKLVDNPKNKRLLPSDVITLKACLYSSLTGGACYKVMLQSGNYDLVHELFRKMRRSGEVPKALTYKVLVRTFWKEGKVDEAVEAVREMESRGVMGTASVYYELACCLCNYGRWQDAVVEVKKIIRLSRARPLEVTFTGMIMSSMDGGHLDDCICIFEYMKNHCTPNIGTMNTMLKVYGRNDMFSKAKELFEEAKIAKSDLAPLEDGGDRSDIPDVYTYSAMLEISASAQQWEYFEHVYREMTLSGCQLDQNKHLTLLVEASRAGKGHLLEHAFDMILETGEIPHHLFFFELVIQAISQHNYERAVILVNTMAYAPYRVTEKQWTDAFKENEDRINHENLQQLLDSLGNCDVVSEQTVSNLSRSLHVLCRLGVPKNISTFVPSGNENMVSGDIEEIDFAENGDAPNIFGRAVMEGTESENDILVGRNDESDTLIFNHDQVNTGENSDAVVRRPQNCNMEHRRSLSVDRVECADDLAPDDESYDSSDEVLWDDGSSEDDDGEGVQGKPSAYEILEAWKEMRKEDSSYLHT